MTTQAQIEKAAAQIAAAHRNAQPCAPVRDLLDANDLKAAYQVQAIVDEAHRQDGAIVSGRKIGLTSRAVQKQLGVDQPDYGTIYTHLEYGSGAPVPMQSLLQPKIEAEVALVLEHDIDAAQPGLADILRATAYAVPALEIVASRIANWDISIVDTIADNASFGAYVLGSPARRLDGLDLIDCAMSMTINDDVASSGTGAACLGNPLNAAVWLARKMAEIGQPLRAGQVILTGALGPMAPVQAGQQIKAEIQGLGQVSCEFV